MSIATLPGFGPEIGAGMVATVAATVFVTGALKGVVGLGPPTGSPTPGSSGWTGDSCQVLEPDFASPSLFVLYWFPDPESGSTTQALRIARARGIPCVKVTEATDPDRIAAEALDSPLEPATTS